MGSRPFPAATLQMPFIQVKNLMIGIKLQKVLRLMIHFDIGIGFVSQQGMTLKGAVSIVVVGLIVDVSYRSHT